ncbi:cytochrome P450 [Gigaspora rosea]|uniref:Cytochrome P450 n=1 Tax=Gigaspora rosea TaxID=44941 RepID=A0A397UME0_9GLOM|nr:cytochrome P450 [Gigaspora rosea]
MTTVDKLPLKFGWNPITQHRDLFVQRCKQIIEERIHQRKELGEKYIQQVSDVADDKLLNNLFGVLYMIVFVSISTTSRAFSFALFDYGGRPELWNELYEEQLKIHNESNGYLSIEDVDKMVKLDSFLKESFRYSTDIANLPHTVIGDSYTFSNGNTIPKGRDVYLYMKDTAFNNKFYEETSIDRSFITFGVSKHACPGRFFAVNEIKMGLHKLILKYNIRTESGKIVPPIKISSLKIPPMGGLVFENRN